MLRLPHGDRPAAGPRHPRQVISYLGGDTESLALGIHAGVTHIAQG